MLEDLRGCSAAELLEWFKANEALDWLRKHAPQGWELSELRECELRPLAKQLLQEGHLQQANDDAPAAQANDDAPAALEAAKANDNMCLSAEDGRAAGANILQSLRCNNATTHPDAKSASKPHFARHHLLHKQSQPVEEEASSTASPESEAHDSLHSATVEESFATEQASSSDGQSGTPLKQLRAEAPEFVPQTQSPMGATMMVVNDQGMLTAVFPVPMSFKPGMMPMQAVQIVGPMQWVTAGSIHPADVRPQALQIEAAPYDHQQQNDVSYEGAERVQEDPLCALPISAQAPAADEDPCMSTPSPRGLDDSEHLAHKMELLQARLQQCSSES